MSSSEYRELTILIANEFDRAREEFRASFADPLAQSQPEFQAHLMRDRESLGAEISLLAEPVRQERPAIDQLAAAPAAQVAPATSQPSMDAPEGGRSLESVTDSSSRTLRA